MNANEFKECRFNGLIDQIEFYYYKCLDGCKLSNSQKKHLIELRNTISVFGEKSVKWEKLCNELLTIK